MAKILSELEKTTLKQTNPIVHAISASFGNQELDMNLINTPLWTAVMTGHGSNIRELPFVDGYSRSVFLLEGYTKIRNTKDITYLGLCLGPDPEIHPPFVLFKFVDYYLEAYGQDTYELSDLGEVHYFYNPNFEHITRDLFFLSSLRALFFKYVFPFDSIVSPDSFFIESVDGINSTLEYTPILGGWNEEIKIKKFNLYEMPKKPFPYGDTFTEVLLYNFKDDAFYFKFNFYYPQYVNPYERSFITFKPGTIKLTFYLMILPDEKLNSTDPLREGEPTYEVFNIPNCEVHYLELTYSNKEEHLYVGKEI